VEGRAEALGPMVRETGANIDSHLFLFDCGRDRRANSRMRKTVILPKGRLFHVGHNERCASYISFLSLHFCLPRSYSVFFPVCPLRARPMPRGPRTSRSCGGLQSRSAPYSLRRSSFASRRVPWPAGVFSHQGGGREGLPPMRPRARAASSPALVRCRITSRSISANAPKRWNVNLPPGVDVSTCSVRL